MDQIIDTRHLPQQERYAFWQEINSGLPLRCDIERVDPESPFNARLEGAILDDILVGYACLSAVRGRRTIQHIAHDIRDHYVLGIPIGQSLVQQDDSEYQLSENEMVLFDGTRPLGYEHGEQAGGITIAIPRYRLESKLAEREVKGVRTARLDQGVGSMVRGFCQSLPNVLTGQPGADVRECLAEQLTALVALSFKASIDGKDQVQSTMAGMRFRAIRAYIDENLHAPDLNVEHLINALGISRSYLYKLFERHGFAFQDHVRISRLNRVEADLCNPSLRALSITEIAVRNGFNSLSHFSRCFRQQFGESPRAYRARMHREFYAGTKIKQPNTSYF